MKPRNFIRQFGRKSTPEQSLGDGISAIPFAENPCGQLCDPNQAYCMVGRQALAFAEIGIPKKRIPQASRIVCTSLVELANNTDSGPDIDDMTGLVDQKTAKIILPSILGSLRKRGESLTTPNPVALLFIDLDGFKIVNDTLGHSAGDRLLAIIGQNIKQAVREGDFTARWGGDEFLIAALIDSEDSAEAFANRILDAITMEFETLPVSASIGVVVVPENTPIDPSLSIVLINEADKAMYHAKHSGKGQVVVY